MVVTATGHRLYRQTGAAIARGMVVVADGVFEIAAGHGVEWLAGIVVAAADVLAVAFGVAFWVIGEQRHFAFWGFYPVILAVFVKATPDDYLLVLAAFAGDLRRVGSQLHRGITDHDDVAADVIAAVFVEIALV